MKIPRPKPAETEFKRKRGPPPQATRLLLSSLAAGLVFMAVLAVVFIPRYLQYANQPPIEVIKLLVSGGGRINVTSANAALDLSLFNATLLRNNVTVGFLASGLSSGTSILNFTDANRDGLLGVGDYFQVTSTPQNFYRLQVWQVDVGKLVGLIEWTGKVS
jgi:hypothetical protein